MKQPNKHSIYDGHLPLQFKEFRVVIIHRRLIDGLSQEALNHYKNTN